MNENAPRNSNGIAFIEAPSLQEAAQHLAEDTSHFLARAIALNGGAFIAVPGGKTPGPFFSDMSQRALDWAKVRITLTDERWVSADSSDSNARLVRADLLRDWAGVANFQPPKTMNSSIEQAATDWDAALRAAPPFDLIVLGMGDDGHFASLFPGDPDLAARLDPDHETLAVAVTNRAPPRLSLTLRAIIGARHLALLIAGDKKRALLDAVLRGEQADLPIAALLRHARAAPSCYWGAKT